MSCLCEGANVVQFTFIQTSSFQRYLRGLGREKDKDTLSPIPDTFTASMLHPKGFTESLC